MWVPDAGALRDIPRDLTGTTSTSITPAAFFLAHVLEPLRTHSRIKFVHPWCSRDPALSIYEMSMNSQQTRVGSQELRNRARSVVPVRDASSSYLSVRPFSNLFHLFTRSLKL